MQKSILLLTFLSFSCTCQAAETCLWMNAATAAGILGGAVVVQVVHTAKDAPVAGTANSNSSAGPMSANPMGPSYGANSTDDEACTFTRRSQAIVSEIRIEVRTMYRSREELSSRLANCRGDKTALRAIGNEADLCEMTHQDHRLAELVMGRVRERTFVIQLTSNDTSVDTKVFRENAETAARIVAGNLF